MCIILLTCIARSGNTIVMILLSDNKICPFTQLISVVKCLYCCTKHATASHRQTVNLLSGRIHKYISYHNQDKEITSFVRDYFLSRVS